jgi:capsular exopolysaccharide synthesis family protein
MVGSESNAMKAEPLVEFSSKKSPAVVLSPLGGNSQAMSSTLDSLTSPFSFSDLLQVPVPRDGGRPLVTSDTRSAQGAIEAYKSLRTRLLKSQTTQGFRSIVVTSVGRAQGKTLTAFNLAYCCANVANLSVLLIDSDMRNRSLTKLMGPMPSVGLADLMIGRARFDEAIVRTDVPNLYVMGSGHSDVPPAELFSTEKWGQIVEWGREHFKIVLVDALSIGSFTDFELIAPECDGILLVVKARSTSQEALKMTLGQLDANKLVGVVWNGSE